MGRIVHVQLGRNGDLLILLPCWWRIFMESAQRPVVVVAREFCGLLRGVSYVESDVVNAHWYGGLVLAAKMARVKYGSGVVVTQCGGVGHDTDEAAYGSFGEAMRCKAGFSGPYEDWPLVFDRRNVERESELVSRHIGVGSKPVVLYNFAGRSSPLGCVQAVRNRLRRWERDFELVNLGVVRAVQLYDLLGLYDLASGLITIDTATLHLAGASKVPMLAYVRGGWSTAIPKAGSVVVPYSEAHLRLEVIDAFMESLKFGFKENGFKAGDYARTV